MKCYMCGWDDPQKLDQDGECWFTIDEICGKCLVKWFKETHGEEEYQVYKKDAPYMEGIYNVMNA